MTIDPEASMANKVMYAVMRDIKTYDYEHNIVYTDSLLMYVFDKSQDAREVIAQLEQPKSYKQYKVEIISDDINPYGRTIRMKETVDGDVMDCEYNYYVQTVLYNPTKKFLEKAENGIIDE